MLPLLWRRGRQRGGVDAKSAPELGSRHSVAEPTDLSHSAGRPAADARTGLLSAAIGATPLPRRPKGGAQSRSYARESPALRLAEIAFLARSLPAEKWLICSKFAVAIGRFGVCWLRHNPRWVSWEWEGTPSCAAQVVAAGA